MREITTSPWREASSKLAVCQCMRHGTNHPCVAAADAEDLLCDTCRTGRCALVLFDFPLAEDMGMHVLFSDSKVIAARVVLPSEAGSEADVRDLRLRRAGPG